MELTGQGSILNKLQWRGFLQRADIMAAFGLVAILMIMIIPLPSLVLDLFLSMNITIALLILVISLFTVKAIDFSIFPAVLLATTLFDLP